MVRGRVQNAAKEALHKLEEKVEHILVHFDVDVIDGIEFPAADVPHKYGLSFWEGKVALSCFLSSPRLAGLVVTEFNPARDSNGALAGRLVDAIVEATARPMPLRGSEAGQGNS